jgi:hypothetical protein
MNLLPLILFGVPAYFVAERKGFSPGRWLFAMGIVGLVVVFCLPSARRRDKAYGLVKSRADLANTVGATLAVISILTGAVASLVALFLHTFK